MATARQWLNLPYEHYGDTRGVCLLSLGMFTYCPSNKAQISQVLLHVFYIAYSQSVPIFRGITSSSG